MHSETTQKETLRAGIWLKKNIFEGKTRLICQAVANVQGRFLDISITYGGVSSDYLAFENIDLHTCLENGSLKDECAFFGDNEYIHTLYGNTISQCEHL